MGWRKGGREGKVEGWREGGRERQTEKKATFKTYIDYKSLKPLRYPTIKGTVVCSAYLLASAVARR